MDILAMPVPPSADELSAQIKSNSSDPCTGQTIPVWQTPPMSQGEIDILLSLGGFATPVCSGTCAASTAALTNEVESGLKRELPSLARIFQAIADGFNAMGATSMDIQLVGYDPADRKHGPDRRTRYWHVDASPSLPDQEFLRITAVLAGTGSEYVASDMVDRVALQHFMKLLLRTSPNAPLFDQKRLAQSNRQIVSREAKVMRVPDGHFSCWKGGVRRGLVHRTPHIRERRVLVVAATYDPTSSRMQL
jgi:hypothetical protein